MANFTESAALEAQIAGQVDEVSECLISLYPEELMSFLVHLNRLKLKADRILRQEFTPAELDIYTRTQASRMNDNV